MTHTQLDNLRAALKAKRSEATLRLGKRDDLSIERTPDALDEVQFAAARELSTRNLERESALLREVRAALDRITAGSYGVCLECEEEISQKRLQAVPWATRCIACQEQSDWNRQKEFENQKFLRAA